MIPGPLGLGPWPEHSQRPKLSPNLIVSPFCFGCMIDKPILVNYELIGDVFARNNPCPRQLGIALGSITVEQSFEGRNQFQCHHRCFDRTYPLSRIINWTPQHTSETSNHETSTNLKL